MQRHHDRLQIVTLMTCGRELAILSGSYFDHLEHIHVLLKWSVLKRPADL